MLYALCAGDTGTGQSSEIGKNQQSQTLRARKAFVVVICSGDVSLDQASRKVDRTRSACSMFLVVQLMVCANLFYLEDDG